MSSMTHNGKKLGKKYRHVKKEYMNKLKVFIALSVLPLMFGISLMKAIGINPVFAAVVVCVVTVVALHKTVNLIFGIVEDDEMAFKSYRIIRDSVDDFGNVKLFVRFKDGTETWINSEPKRSFALQSFQS